MNKEIVNEIVKKVKESEECVIKRYKEKKISEEEDITAQLAGKISELIDNIKEGNIQISAKVYTRKGKNSEEKITGADLSVILENNSVKKAFLVQSKKGERRNGYIVIKKDRQLKNQCKKMLGITSDSFIFIYTTQGIFVVPSLELSNVKNRHIENGYRRLHTFFMEFLKCFIGDNKIVEIAKDPKGMLEFADTVLYIKINYW